MNKVYRLIWDSSRQMLIPVSELSASHGKKNVIGSFENPPRFIFRLKAIVLAFAAWQGGVFVPAANAFTADGGALCTAADETAGICVQKATTGSAASIAIATGAKASNNAIALGVNAIAGDTGAVAIGTNANAQGQYSLAIGDGTSATGTKSIVLGAGASSVSTDAGISLGYHNILRNVLSNDKSYSSNMIALGNENILDAAGRTMVFGSWNRVDDDSKSSGNLDAGTLVMGLNNNIKNSHNAYVLGGSGIVQDSKKSILIGQYANITSSDGAIMIGGGTYDASANKATISTVTNSAKGIAIGELSQLTDASEGIILGNKGSVTAVNGLLLGNAGKVSASNGVALGNNTTVSNSNAVALGSGSESAAPTDTTGATIAGKAYQFAGGTANSTVSIGNNTVKRTLTNLAAGRVTSASTDAVNGSQLYATNSAVNTLYNSVTGLADDALLWDSSKNAYSATHGTATKNKITNVAIGNVDATSTDAVNGSQLFATNQQVTNNTNNINTLANSTLTFTGNTGSIAKKLGETLGVKGGKTTAGTYSAANMTTEVDNSGNLIIQMADNPVFNSAIIGGTTTLDKNGLTITGGPSVTTAGISAAGKKVTNVAIGNVDAISTDAVNGSQLFATNQQVTNNTNNINTLANSTLTFTGNTGSIAKKLGETLGVKGGKTTAGTYSAANMTTEVDNSGNLIIQMADNPVFNSAIIGGTTTLDKNGLTITGGPSVTTAGISAAGKKVTNVAIGNVDATSTDAVNGSQLFATNQNIANVDASVKNIYATGTKYFHANSKGADSIARGNDAVAIGMGAVATYDNDVALGAGAITTKATGTDKTTLGGVEYNFAGQTPVGTLSIGDVGSERTITNVAAGRLSQNSTDAVNGSQLYATNSAVNSLYNNVSGLQSDALLWDANLNAFSASHGTSVENKITNVAAGDLTNVSTDAVNGSQLFATNQNIANVDASVKNIYATGTKYFHANSKGADSIARGNDAVAIGMGAVATYDNDVALGAGAITTKATGTDKTTLGGVEYNFAGQTPVGTLSIGDVGSERTITNVAAGRLSQNSTDAVNGSQLYATNRAVNSIYVDVQGLQNDALLWDPALNAFSASHGSTTINKITNVAAGELSETSTDAVNGSQLHATNVKVQNIDNRLVDVEDVVYGNIVPTMRYLKVNSNGTEATASGADAVALGQGTVASGDNSVATGNGAQASGSGSIASGHNSNAAGEASVAIGENASVTANNSVALGAGSVADRDNTVSVGSSGNERQITNVAAGTEDTDAVNVAQLKTVSGDVSNLGNTVNNIANGTDGMFQVNNTDNHAKPVVTGTNAVAGGAGSTASGNNSLAVGTLASSSGENSVALGNGSSSKASNSVALGANSVADRNNTVSVGAVGSERQITNVAAGTELTDAVNVSQLKQTESSANQYTNKQFNALKNMVNDQKDKLSAGIAGAMAMSGLPQPYSPGASMVGMAGGTYQGQSAIALGVSTISDNGKWVTKLSGSTNSQGDFGAAIGIGYQW